MPYADPDTQRRYQRQWAQNNRRRWLSENGPCAKCGSDKDMEVDHIDRTKKISHRVWSWTKDRRDEELRKCQVLCGSCHKEKTSLEKQRPIKHGTESGYARCRCSSCTEAHRIYVANRRAVRGY